MSAVINQSTLSFPPFPLFPYPPFSRINLASSCFAYLALQPPKLASNCFPGLIFLSNVPVLS